MQCLLILWVSWGPGNNSLGFGCCCPRHIAGAARGGLAGLMGVRSASIVMHQPARCCHVQCLLVLWTVPEVLVLGVFGQGLGADVRGLGAAVLAQLHSCGCPGCVKRHRVHTADKHTADIQAHCRVHATCASALNSALLLCSSHFALCLCCCRVCATDRRLPHCCRALHSQRLQGWAPHQHSSQ